MIVWERAGDRSKHGRYSANSRQTSLEIPARTLIANAVTVDHAAIQRLPAREERDDTDLGNRPVTVAVGARPQDAIDAALSNGLQVAEGMRQRGLIHAACLRMRHDVRTCGPVLDAAPASLFLRPPARPSA